MTALSQQKRTFVGYFEIPVGDMDRAIAFYEAVFLVTLERETVDGYQMALFPFDENLPGASGALAYGDVYKPSLQGVLVYFATSSIHDILIRAVDNGGEILLAKQPIGDLGYVAEFKDSEGNRIALHERPVGADKR